MKSIGKNRTHARALQSQAARRGLGFGTPHPHAGCLWSWPVLLSWLIVAGVVAARPGRAQSFRAEGEFCQTNYTQSGTVYNIVNARFCAKVEGQKAGVRLDFGPNYYTEWDYDGATAYILADSPDNINEVKGLHAAASVHEGEFPACAGSLVRTLWLGLCSAHYFSESTNEVLLAPWSELGFRGALSFRWDMERFAAPPGLPKRIVFRASRALWDKEAQGRVPKEKGDMPFRDGFVGGEFEVVATQSLGALTLPRTFVFTRYRVGQLEGRVLSYTRVSVRNLAAASGSRFIPSITRATDVSDMRDETPEMPGFGFTYTITNDAWLAKSDPRRLALLAANRPAYEQWRRGLALKAAGSAARKSPLRHRLVIAAVLIFLVSFPIAWVWWSQEKQ